MAMRYGKTEHAGAKNRGAKSGFWGKRAIAKEFSRKGRRRNDAVRVDDELVLAAEAWRLRNHVSELEFG